jgi:hypothetical protein
MTPFARKLSRDPAWQSLLARSTCFDFTPVQQMIPATIQALCDGADPGPDGSQFNHGGLLVAPAEFFWFEVRLPAGSVGWSCQFVEDQIGVLYCQPGKAVVAAALELLPDDQARIFSDTRLPCPPGSSPGFALPVAAMLVMLNAPKGFRQKPVAAHRGHAKQIRRLTGITLKPAHTVHVDLSAGDVSPSGSTGTGGAPKAFHFCRAHRRNLGDRSIRLRAHWRGDPALGVCQSTYEVRP